MNHINKFATNDATKKKIQIKSNINWTSRVCGWRSRSLFILFSFFFVDGHVFVVDNWYTVQIRDAFFNFLGVYYCTVHAQ